jgi:hypothetical protein
MPYEILHGIIGSTIAEVVSHFFPPRKTGEFVDLPPETLRHRNSRMYAGLLPAFIVGFGVPFLLLMVRQNILSAAWEKHYAPVWFALAFFSLPFSTMLTYCVAIWCMFGGKRLRELLFYCEIKQKSHSYVLCALVIPMALLGFISSVAFFL